MKARAEIDAGVCGFHTVARASSDDDMYVIYDIQTECEKIRNLASLLIAKGPINVHHEIDPTKEGVIMDTVRATLKGCCAGCAVPVGIFKAAQVATGLALPRDIVLRLEKE